MSNRHNQHPEDVKASVRKTGITLSELGRRNGLSTSAVRKSLYRPIPSANRVVAAYLRRRPHELWPEWYDAEDNRIPGTGPKPSSGRTAAHRQKRWRP